MQCTSYFINPSEQALLTLQVREAELRVAREELAFLQACGGAGEADVRRLRAGLGMGEVVVALRDDHDVVVVKEEYEDDISANELVSLKSILTPLIATDSSVAQLCRRVRPVLERQGMPVFKRRKAVHVRRGDADRALEVGRGVWAGLH